MSLAPVVVLAGGLGTRIATLTEHAGIPKALVPVNGIPFIDHKLAELARAGADEVVLLVGHRAAVLQSHVGDGAAHGLRVTFLHDGPELLGTGGAVRRAAQLLPPLFWVTYGDTLLDVPMATIEADFAPRPALVGMTVLRNRDRWDPSNARVAHGLVVEYRKGAPPGTFEHIDYGMLLLRATALEVVGSAMGPFDLGEVLGICARTGQIQAYEVENRFHEIGTPEGLAETEAWLRIR